MLKHFIIIAVSQCCIVVVMRCFIRVFFLMRYTGFTDDICIIRVYSNKRNNFFTIKKKKGFQNSYTVISILYSLTVVPFRIVRISGNIDSKKLCSSTDSYSSSVTSYLPTNGAVISLLLLSNKPSSPLSCRSYLIHQPH